MKKSKVLAISLGAVALTTVAVATPVILTSCSDEASVLLADNFITLGTDSELNTAPTGASLKRTEGTNNWDYNVGEKTLSAKQLTFLKYNFESMITKEQFDSLGLSKENLSYGFTITKNGKDIEPDKNNNVTDFDETADKTKPQKIEYKIWLVNGTDANNITKKVAIPYSITMIPSK